MFQRYAYVRFVSVIQLIVGMRRTDRHCLRTRYRGTCVSREKRAYVRLPSCSKCPRSGFEAHFRLQPSSYRRSGPKRQKCYCYCSFAEFRRSQGVNSLVMVDVSLFGLLRLQVQLISLCFLFYSISAFTCIHVHQFGKLRHEPFALGNDCAIEVTE